MTLGYRCPLGRLIPNRPDVEQIKQDGWQQDAILVVGLSDPRLSAFEQSLVKQLGERLYGKRR